MIPFNSKNIDAERKKFNGLARLIFMLWVIFSEGPDL